MQTAHDNACVDAANLGAVHQLAGRGAFTKNGWGDVSSGRIQANCTSELTYRAPQCKVRKSETQSVNVASVRRRRGRQPPNATEAKYARMRLLAQA